MNRSDLEFGDSREETERNLQAQLQSTGLPSEPGLQDVSVSTSLFADYFKGFEGFPSRLLPLAALWRGLATGALFFRGAWYSEARCGLLVERRCAHRDEGESRRVAILQRILCGQSQKAVAAQFGISTSTVAVDCSDALRGMGREHLTSRAPVLLMMAAHAAGGRALPNARMRTVNLSHGELLVIVADRPDARTRQLLTDSERVVFSLLVEGSTHAEIALSCNKSCRTVANQLAAAYRKLGESRRAAVVARLLSA
jgi:DNA-binding NarL/FixJ family response regulator